MITAKERVLAAVSMKPAQTVPCDFHACAPVLERLYKRLGVNTYANLLAALGAVIADIRGVVDPDWVAPFPKETRDSAGVKRNWLGFETKIQDTVFGQVEEHCGYALSSAQNLEELEKHDWPQTNWFDFSTMKKRLEPYRDFAVMASGASVFQHPALVRGLDNLLCDMLSEPEMAQYIIGKYTDFYLSYYDTMFSACKGCIDIFRIADDLGMQDRLLVSPALFTDFVAPQIARLCDMAHSHGIKVMFHSCGAVFDYIASLIECGVDILDPLQPAALGMNPENLTEFLGKICLHGSIDTQYTLPQGTEEEVRHEVRLRFEVLGKNKTGFIIAPSHTLQPDVKTENILAMYDEIRRLNAETQ